MNEYDIKRLALVLAKQAEMEGMMARNKEKNIDSKNPDLPTYTDDDFWRVARELEDIAYKHNEQL